jgi:AcrR family transcriptional regulator
VDAALALFAEKGFAAARLDEVAARAGIAKGTIYLYFDSKEALFEAVVRARVLPVLDEAGTVAAAYQGSTAELLRALLKKLYAELVGSDLKQILRLLVAEAGRAPHLAAFYHREVLSRGKGLLGAVLRRGVERGEFRRAPALDMPEVVMGPAIMAAVWTLVFQAHAPLDLDAFFEAHVDLALNGLLRREGESARP